MLNNQRNWTCNWFNLSSFISALTHATSLKQTSQKQPQNVAQSRQHRANVRAQQKAEVGRVEEHTHYFPKRPKRFLLSESVKH